MKRIGMEEKGNVCVWERDENQNGGKRREMKESNKKTRKWKKKETME